MIDNILKFKDFVPLFQTIIWIVFFGVILVIFRKLINDLISVLIDRIRKSSFVKLWGVEFEEKLRSLEHIDLLKDNRTPEKTIMDSNGVEREKHREKIYENNHGLFLTHILTPSNKAGYKDIYIYLIRHKPQTREEERFLDIEKAEFFFGHMWNNQIFQTEPRKGIVGISASAYAPFLCTCFVKLKNGSEIELYRYIDFGTEKR